MGAGVQQCSGNRCLAGGRSGSRMVTAEAEQVDWTEGGTGHRPNPRFLCPSLCSLPTALNPAVDPRPLGACTAKRDTGTQGQRAERFAADDRPYLSTDRSLAADPSSLTTQGQWQRYR
jgi:hypothetical protein